MKVNTLLVTLLACLILFSSEKSRDYERHLELSFLFYEAQRSGKLPETNRIYWRHDSMLKAGYDAGIDLTGGYYDAGDNCKFNFPGAGALTLIAWSGIDFQKGYERAKQRVVNSSIDLAKSKVGHQTSTVSNNSITLKNENCYCIMLPVWMVNIKYKGKMHTFAMNGDTGKIVGDIPIGVKETVLWSIGLFILFFTLCFAIVYFGGI
jgi:hypothetical protein